MNWSTKTTRIATISIKIHEVNFGNSILDKSKLDEISNSVAKKSLSGTEWDSLWEEKT